MNDIALQHICEVCGIQATLTPSQAFKAGWDYPPHMGTFAVIGPRVCPACPCTGTVWWAIAVDGLTLDMLSQAQCATVERILGEPGSIAVASPG
ncbi:hypothetical protein [Mycobacteroides abscessus]|uniref:Uncharacterized protein n=3 Tax=Mycobacteroides abscessus TaxID=36809 RepID=B1MMA3_MYCA9|nr:hypothetical protein [Mycobacteroides abscessus]EUA63604.1 hypothetical protein I542_3761 [Mycobacteroides abscessus 1948]ALM18939.1 hypothetical protein AOY11_24315 [Mycobacteroides abscessus]AMU48002.1 hypothetical protein A3O00_24180 [Mycobacteroides abscessus]AMU53041.1 hypothetical protein A3O01_24895 [Mycobacteroides abscessus]AMU57997.1 hypothetical protein A3O02_24530 [Mycobacteroides abscessus]